MVAGGCATPFYTSEEARLEHKFFANYGELRLVSRNNDIRLEKLNSSDEGRQITHTPSLTEGKAFFVLSGKYIVYDEEHCCPFERDFFIIPADSDDSQRKEITVSEWLSWWAQRNQ